MIRGGPHGTWIIAVSLLAAFMLTALPLPAWAAIGRPAWVAMAIMYWGMAVPARVGIVTGWCTGILMDVLTGALFGQHALGLALIGYFAVTYHKRLRVFSLVQQAFILGIMLFGYALLMAGIDNIAGIPFRIESLFSVVTSMLLWPWVFIVLRDIRRRGHVT